MKLVIFAISIMVVLALLSPVLLRRHSLTVVLDAIKTHTDYIVSELIGFIILILIVTSWLSGCTTVEQKATPAAKALVAYYCAQPVDARALLRESIDAAIAPASIKLTCPGDGIH